MTTLTYSHTLVAGTPEDVNDVQDMFEDVRTLVNGNFDDSNIANDSLTTASLATSAKPVTLLGAYQAITGVTSLWVDTDTSGNRYLTPNGLRISGTNYVPISQMAAPGLVAMTVNDYAVSGLTTQARLRVGLLTNSVAPAITFTVGLYPVTVGGTADNIALTLGTVVSGSTIAFVSPTADTAINTGGTDFTPTNGMFALGVNLSGTPTANSAGLITARLDVHHI